MPSETEPLALHFVRVLYEATEAIVFAVAGMGACRGRPIHLPYRCRPAYDGIALVTNAESEAGTRAL